MYDSNYLVKRLRQASLSCDEECFAYMDESHQVCYREFFENVEKVAATLIEEGLQPGGRVAVQVEKSIQAVELYLGVILAGGIFLPLNTAYTVSELAYFLSDAQPEIFVVEPEKYATLKPLADRSQVNSFLTLAADGAGSLMDKTRQQRPGFTGAARAKTDLAAILYTSGTTGRSKGAMLSHQNLASNALVLKEVWQFHEKDVLIHALPIFHVHGLFVAINVTLVSAAKMLFHSKFDTQAIIADFSRATVFMGVPTFYVRLLAEPQLDKVATSLMRLFISGSAPLLVETHDDWEKHTGHTIIERYGLTETGMNTSNPYDGERRAGTVGLPLPGVEVIVAELETGEPLPEKTTGSVEVRGPNVFSGYWKMPEKTAEEIRSDGFFITGDLGYFDNLGYLSIVGRSKDLIISGGYNIYPKEIELLIDGIPGVYESAVIGLPHTDFGEGVAAVVVRRQSTNIEETDVLNALSDKLARFKQPKIIFFVEQLPRNAMGKVQKKILRETFQEAFR